MKRLIAIFILLVSLILTGCTDKKSAASTEVKNNKQESNALVLPTSTNSKSLSDSQNGVDVSIENIRKEDGKTVLELSLSNHRYDLSAMDAINRTNFNGIKPEEYIVKTSAMGGHHIQSEMVFEGNLAGSLTIGLGESLTFNFNIQ